MKLKGLLLKVIGKMERIRRKASKFQIEIVSLQARVIATGFPLKGMLNVKKRGETHGEKHTTGIKAEAWYGVLSSVPNFDL